MEQRVRDLIELLQKFDLDLRVSEKTTLNFKYDGYATRLVVECDNTDYEAEIAKLHKANAKLEGYNEDLLEKFEKLEDDKVSLQSRVADLEDERDNLKASIEAASTGH